MLTRRALDVARSAYVGLPPSVRRTVGPILQLLPLRFRFGRSYFEWRQAIAEARRHPETVAHSQRSALMRVLQLARDKSPYYRETLSGVIGEAGALDAAIGSEFWSRIPVIDGSVVRREGERMCTRSTDELDSCSTGGSSGQPLSFFLDKNRSPIEYAFVMEAWSAAGCTEEDWQATFRGFYNPDPATTPCEVESGLKELRFSVFHMTDELMPRYLAEIERRGIEFLKGYPSSLANLAAFALRAGLINESIRGILLHSEYVHSRYRQLLARAFPNARILSFYGLSEKCAFAVEVAGRPGEYDFDPLYGVTELLDDRDRPITTPGKRGRIVSTGLLFKGMPFIRYATGDEGVLVAAASEANGWRMRLSGVTPRYNDEFVVTRSGHLFHVGVLFMVDDELSAVTDLQFEQSEPGELHVRCVLAPERAASGTEDFIRMVRERTGGEMSLHVTIVDRIPLSPRGKRPVLIQHLDTERFGGGLLEECRETLATD